jgi:Predicted acetyltransferases and hydrolases with the alpha/beta hydrolase fold
MYLKGFTGKLISLALCLGILCGSFINLAAQVRRAGQTAGANQSKTSAPKCSGAWTGTITYTRVQSMSDNKTTQRVSGRGHDTRNWQMNYNYKAQVAVVEAPEKDGRSIGKATINHSFNSTEKISSVEKNSCDQGKTWRDMRGESLSITETTASGTGEARVHIGVNSDGTYTVSVGIPSITGKTSGSQSYSYSGQCTPKEGKNLTMPATDTRVDGNAITTDGTHRINPSDPNRLSGSYTQTWQNVTETITWNLQKCGAPLRLIDLKFEDMKFPNWGEWQEIAEQKGTIDGNLVRIKAKVLNASGETKYADVRFKETYKGDKWDGAKPDAPLDDSVISVRLDPGEEKEVEFVWDSSGYAWYDDGRPRLVQRIKAELEENGKKADEMTKNLKVAPKPVVLVHGLWSSWRAWETWQNILTTAHSYDWKAFPVGEKPEKGIMNTGGSFMSSSPTNSIFENSQQLGKYIRYAQEDRNAWHVDIVAHSMGGLISRHYIHHFMPNSPDGRPLVAHLVMLGTPNMGSPCADVMNFVFETTGKKVEAIRQLKPSVVEEFNKVTTNRKGVKFSVLAGNSLPVMCKTVVWNDGVVPVPSAVWKIRDNAMSSSIHTDLTGTKDFTAFVKPRLAIGPKGDHNPAPPELPDYPNQINQNRGNFAPVFVNAAYKPLSLTENFTDEEFLKPNFAKAVRLAPKQSLEIEIPVEQAQNFGITFMADPNISATLFNDKGVIVGKNTANTPEARAWFRSIYFDKPVTAGTWKLKLENTADTELEAALATWKDAVK